MVCQAVEAETVFLHELMVVEVLADNDIYHCEGQRAFTARLELEPVIGLFGKPDAPRVYDDLLFGLHEAAF